MRLVVLRLMCVATLTALTAAPGFAQEDDAWVAYATGRYDDAIEQFERATSRQPASVSAARGLMRAFFAVGRYADAEEAAHRFERDNSESVELANALGEVLVATGRAEDAETAFRRADGGASDSLQARLNLALLQLNRGEISTAMGEFDRFIDVYNGSSTLSSDDLTSIGTAVQYLGRHNSALFYDALRAYDEAIAADPRNPEPRILVGDLFLEKYRGSDALEAFESFLQLNPNEPRALLGVARAHRFNGSSQAFALARKSIAANPSLVSARVFLAQLHLEAEQYDEALDELRQAFEVNPMSLEALAMEAGARYLMGDAAGYQRAVNRSLQLNPRNAALYNTLAEVSARNRLYAEAAAFARQSTELDSTSWRGYALLGINELRIGKIDEGRSHLETAFAGDPFDVWTFNTLDLLDTLVNYEETESSRFVFAVDRKESALLAIYLSELAEDAYETLAQKYDYHPPTPVRVEVYPSHADFSVRTVGLAGLGALGVSFGPVIAMDSPSARELGQFNWGSTFWHELAHTFHLGLSGHKVPRWFTEGLAVYEERRARDGWGDDVNPGFLAAYNADRLHPVSELNNGFMRPEYPQQLGFSYLQASYVCELIERDFGFEALPAMLRAYGNGLSNAEVFQSVLHTEIEQFDRLFDAYMTERFGAALTAVEHSAELGPDGEVDPNEVVRRANREPNDFLANLLAGQVMIEQRDSDRALEYFMRARAAFPEYGGDDSPHWFLAQIYREKGRTRQAAEALEALTAINENHFEARLELAALYAELNDPAGAARTLQETVYVYPLESSIHVRLADLYDELERWPNAIRERRAVVALDPVDRAEALYQLALAQYRGGELAEARRTVLGALEDAPNFQKAQELLLELYEKRSRTND